MFTQYNPLYQICDAVHATALAAHVNFPAKNDNHWAWIQIISQLSLLNQLQDQYYVWIVIRTLFA